MNQNIETDRHKRKFFDFIYNNLINKKDIKILEFGVSERGVSTELFLELCEKNQGELISIDTNANSKNFNSKKWTFINTRDDNFLEIEKFIKNKKFDVIYLDTIHKADHVKKILFHYFKYLKSNGLFFVDDTSLLPYLHSREKNNFSQEINNQETFDKILEIYNENHENIDLEFSFVGTGIAKIRRLNDNGLKDCKKIKSRRFTVKNFLRKIYKIFFKL